MTQVINGSEFYQQMALNIKPMEDVSDIVKHRKFLYIKFYLSVAGDELNTYLEVNEPATGIIQEKPEYTNVINGIGIFSTRIKTYSQFQKELNTSSDVELYSGTYTSNLGFCANTGQYACN